MKRSRTIVRISLVLLILTSFVLTSVSQYANAQIPSTSQVVADDGQINDQFGASVAMRGNLLVVGANQRHSTTGAAYVYTRVNGVWTYSSILTANDGQPNDAFGSAVTANDSANTIVVTAPGKNSGVGAAYVFTLVGSPGVWTQTAKLTANDGLPGDLFGYSLGLSGSTILIGAPHTNSNKGAGYVFNGSGSTWTQKAKLVANDAQQDSWVGFSAAIYGNTLVLGALEYHIGPGSAYIFTRSSGTWTQKAKLLASDGQNWDGFGNAVAINGNTIVVGAVNRNGNTGAAYIYSLLGVSWVQQQILSPADGQPQSSFGYSVAASSHGRYVAVGAPSQSINPGSVSLYDFSRYGTWKLQASDGLTGDALGWSVALYGNKLAAGAFHRNWNTGAVYTSP